MSRTDPHTQPEDGNGTETDPNIRDDHGGQAAAEARPESRSTTGSRRQYRGLAAMLFVIGLGFVLFPLLSGESVGAARVMVAMGGIGIFGGVLSYYLTQDRFVAAAVDERIQAAAARNYEGIRADLGLSSRRIYVPVGAPVGDDTDRPLRDHEVRLYIPKQAGLDLQEVTAPAGESVVMTNATGISGLSLHPAGGDLFAAFRSTLNAPLETNPQGMYQQLSDAVVEEFDLARSVTAEISPEQDRMSVTFSDVLYDTRPRFDHPLVSVFAVGLAVGLDSPVETTIPDTDSFSVTFHWQTGTKPSAADPNH